MNLIKKHVRIIAVLCMACLLGSTIVQPSMDVEAAGPIISVSHPEHNTIKLSWNGVEGASGYNIYMGSSSDTQLQYISSVNDTKFSFSNLGANSKYNFKIVPYKTTVQGNQESTPSDAIQESSNRMGIDVSKWQGDIDWAKLKAESNVNFVIMRIGYSTNSGNGIVTNLDEKFVQNMKNAKANGFKVGVYYYSKATNQDQARQEASFVVNNLQGYTLEYPVAFDIEDADQKTQTKLTNSLSTIAFCEAVKAAGYSPMVYCSMSFMNDYLDYESIKQYDIWMARYNSYLGYEGPVRMWQYSSSAILPGITANSVDVDYEYDYKDTIKGSVVFDLGRSGLYYKVAAGDTFATVSTKSCMTVPDILAQNLGFTEASPLADGQNVALHNINLAALAPSAPTNLTAKVSGTTATLNFTKSDNASAYNLYRSTDVNGTYTKVASITSTSYKNTGLNKGTTYYYKVDAVRYNGGTTQISSFSNVATASIAAAAAPAPTKKPATVKAPSKPTSVKARSAGVTSIKVTWKKVSGASKYYVYRATSKKGSYKKVATVTGASYTNKKLTTGKTYYYKVYAVKVSGTTTKKSAASAIVSAKPVPGKPTIKSAKGSKKQVKVTWKKVSSVSGYRVYAATKKNGSYKQVRDVKGTSYTVKKLKSKKTYYYKVKAYKVVKGKKVFGSASSVKGAKTK